MKQGTLPSSPATQEESLLPASHRPQQHLELGAGAAPAARALLSTPKSTHPNLWDGAGSPCTQPQGVGQEGNSFAFNREGNLMAIP